MDKERIKSTLVEINQKRKAKKKEKKSVKRYKMMPLIFMLFFSFYALVTNIFFIIWMMVKYIVRKSGMNKRKRSLLDNYDLLTVLATSIFPQSTPSYLNVAGKMSRFRLKRKLKKELKKKKGLARTAMLKRAIDKIK